MVITLPIETPADFSFLETVHSHGWRALAPFRWIAETETLERVETLPSGQTVCLSITAPGDRLQVSVDDDLSADDRAAAVERVRHILQLDIAIDAFHDYCRTEDELTHIPERRQGRMLRSPTLFEDTVKVIATANTTWAQTVGMVSRLCDSFGSSLPGVSQRRSFPTPDQIAGVPFDEFAAKARMGYRNASVYRIAQDVVSGALPLEQWSNEPDSAALRKKLLSLPGIGPYGSACLLLYLGHGGHVNVDSWARMLLSRELGRPVTDKEVHAFFERYGEWRGLVYQFYRWRHRGDEFMASSDIQS